MAIPAAGFQAVSMVAKGLGMEFADLFRFTSNKLANTNPHLAELVALLEQRNTADTKRALELVKAVLVWKDE